MRGLFYFIRFASLLMLVLIFTLKSPVAVASSDNSGKSTVNLDLISSTSTEVQLKFELNEFLAQKVFKG
ncbi:MAG: hypothetical protein HN356_15135, partial [Calditrichaeota bacterium]|nr:hypothetical protein [Calditrichota bacterium]